MDPASAKLIGAGLAAIGTGAPPSASATCSASSCRARCATRRPPTASSARLIFGFAVTEALGIFALLIAFLLLFT